MTDLSNSPSRRLFLATGPAAAVFASLSAAVAGDFPSSIRDAIFRHKAALAALDAAFDAAGERGEDPLQSILDEERDALLSLARAPCRDAGELIDKLRHLTSYERRMSGVLWLSNNDPLHTALDAFFNSTQA